MKKSCIKSDFKEISLKVATNGKVIKPFCWHEKFGPWGLSVPVPGLYTCIKSWKKMYKISFKEIFLKLVTNDRSDKMFLLTSQFRPKGLSAPTPGLYTCIKSWKKKCTKSGFNEICLTLVANDRSEKRFLLTSNFYSLALSAPDLRLYTFIKSWKDVYKVRGWRDSFLNLQQMTIVMRPSCWHNDINILALMGCLPLSKGYV